MHQVAFSLQVRNVQWINADQDITRRQAGQFIVGEHALHGKQPASGRAESPRARQQLRQGRERSRYDTIK